MNTAEITSIAVIRLSSMGDVLLSTALFRHLRRHFPAAYISAITDDRFADCLRCNPRINSVIEYSAFSSTSTQKIGIKPTFSDQTKQSYDVVVDLQKNQRSRTLRKILGGKVLKIRKDRLKKIALVQAKWNLYREIVPMPERYRTACAELQVADDGDGLELWLPEEASKEIYPPAVRVRERQNRIAIAPGAHHATKRWLPEYFAEVAQKIGIKPEIFLLGGTADQPLCKEIAEKIGSDRTCRDFSGATSIFETARLIDQCDLVITNDTGVQHIAAARRAPVVAIFGSTVQEFGFAPFRTPFRVVERALPCRPCTHIGRAQCPRGDFACMTEVLPHDVLSSAESLLQEVFLSFPS